MVRFRETEKAFQVGPRGVVVVCLRYFSHHDNKTVCDWWTECTLRDEGGANLLCDLHGIRISYGTPIPPKG